MKGKAITKPSSSPTLSFRIQLLLLPREEALPTAHEPSTVWAEGRKWTCVAPVNAFIAFTGLNL